MGLGMGLTFEEMIGCVGLWGEERGLMKTENARAQMLKVMEEVGETSRAILKGDTEGQRDGIGDCFVTLIILSRQLGFTPQECLLAAWDEIKDRKGVTVGGTFIKEGGEV
jgi:hypothetical protein